MRSRYVAYTRGDIDYIARTLAPESRAGFDADAVRAWSLGADWMGLRILATEQGQAGDSLGRVDFIATYRQDGRVVEHRERSRFRRGDLGQWLFVEGAAGGGAPAPVTAKVGRNEPCPCGSGRKFKKCCGA